MKTSLLSLVAVTIIIALLVLSSTLSGTTMAKPGVLTSSPEAHGARLVRSAESRSIDSAGSSPLELPGASSLPSNPANCRQGNHTIDLSPLGIGHSMSPTFVSDYRTLGAEGGGTLVLGTGYYQLNQSIIFGPYGNVSIQGNGMGKTIITLPPSPVGKYMAANGSYVTNLTAVPAITSNLLTVGARTWNFEMCDLSIDAQANNATNDWFGSTVWDTGGGVHHVYSDISEIGFYGPKGVPNGIHLNGYSGPATNYVVDGLYSNATSDFWPPGPWTISDAGPNYLNTGDIADCTEENIAGLGNFAFEVAPDPGCLIENTNDTGALVMDPTNGSSNAAYGVPAGSWGGTLFQNVTVSVGNTSQPYALSCDVSNGTAGAASDFSDLRWNDIHVTGPVVTAGRNMIDVTNSTFYGGINSLPAIFENNTVTWVPSIAGSGALGLPIVAYGGVYAAPGTASVLSGNTFLFLGGARHSDLFTITVPQNTWLNDTIEVSGAANGYLLSAPGVAISQDSSFSQITYDSLGNGSPPELLLVDMAGSPDFQDLGATVGHLTRVYNNLPLYIPTTPDGLTAAAKGPTEVAVSWNASSGPVTNYTVLVGDSATSLVLNYSAGLDTHYVVGGLTPEGVYFVGVEAWNFSFHSSIATPIEVATPPMPIYAPGVPTGLAVASLGTSEVGIRWNPSTGNVTNYTVFDGANASTLTPRFSVGNVTNFTVTGLGSDTTYCFAVEAWNFSSHSSVATPIEVTTLPLPEYAPSVPTGLAVASVEAFEVGIRWSPSTGNVTNYTIYAGTNASTLTPRFSVGSVTNFTVTGLDPGTTYYFAVEAWNGSWASGRSIPVNATTLPASVPPGTGSLSISDWLVVFGTMVGAFGAVVGPIIIVSRRETAIRARGRARSRGVWTSTSLRR